MIQGAAQNHNIYLLWLQQPCVDMPEMAVSFYMLASQPQQYQAHRATT